MITVNSTPATLSSLHDELYFVVSSDNAAAANFKYVFDVRIGGALVSRVKLFPDLTGKGIFDASNIVRNYWTSYFKPSTTRTAFAHTSNDIRVNYEIQFGEEVGDTLTSNMTSGNYKAYNFAPAVFGSNFAQGIISNRDKLNITYSGTEKLFTSYFQDASGNVSLSVNGSSGSAVSCSSFVLLDISPQALSAYLGTTVSGDYTVTIGSQTLKVKQVCPKFETASLHFLNELGGYDTFSFRLVNKQTRDIERKTFEQKQFALSGSSMVAFDSYRRRNGGNVTFGVKQKVGMKLTSDYLTKTDHDWLRELIASPEVYYEKDGYYYPATIKTSNWEEKLRISDKNFNLTLEIELTNTNSQYR